MTAESPQTADRLVASIFFGCFWGFFGFAVLKAAHQTHSIRKRKGTIWTLYIGMIWGEAIVNLAFCILTYLFVREVVPPSFVYFFFTVVLWAFQTQILPQIIANRVGLVMVDKKKARMLKLVLFVLIAIVQVAVFCIWIPALMEVSPTFVKVNHIFERVEKSFFLVIDLALNLYFLRLVRSNLILKGLGKYWPLFNFNIGAVVLSTCMDILLLGLISLPSAYSYIQFAPVAYIVKLNIELTMAELIAKIVRHNQRPNNHNSSTTDPSHGVPLTSVHRRQQHNNYFPGSGMKAPNVLEKGSESSFGASDPNPYEGEGIMKTVSVQLQGNDEDRDNNSARTMLRTDPDQEG